MRQLFISYARENKPDVEALIRDLDALGYQTWVDSSLRGGQTWWEEILRRIAESDVFVAIVSTHTLNSVACQRELEWALALNKPVLPVAVERLPQALPLTLSTRQIVDYSKPGEKAGSALAGALGTLPAEPPAPEQLPEPPPAPLSYQSDLMEQVGQPEPLTHAQQHQFLTRLQPALRSADPEEREGGRYVLKIFSSRDDLYADVDRTLAQLELADHLDVAARREQAARTAQRRKALVDEMTALHQTGQSDAVVAAAQELAGLDPEYPDPGGIVSDAKAKIRHADLSERSGQAWAQATELFSAIEQEPGYRDAAALLKAAEQQRQLAGWLDQAEAAAGHDDWDTAVTALENLCAVDPAYRDAGARLEQARSARLVKQRRSLVDEMTALHQAGRWKEVLAAAEKLAQLDPDHPDPGGMVSDAQAKIRDAQLAEQYAQALNHLDQRHWQQAVEVFTAIEQEQPGYRDAAALLKAAEQQRQLAGWLDQAEAAAGHDDWDTAVTALENLCAVDPAYRDAGARLEQARSARLVKQRRSLVDEMTALHQAGRWKEVRAAAEKLAQLDPDHPDPGGMVSDAQAKIRDAQLAEQYAQALNHLDQRHWQQAVEVFTAIEQEQPGYRDAAALLKAAEQQRQLAGWLDQAEAAAGHDDWDTAVTALENLCAVDPAYRDAGARLEQARSARLVKQRRSLVDEMTALHQAGRWKEVLAAAEKLAQLDPDHPDPGGMVSDAQAKIRDAQLAEQYAQALNHLDQRHWQQAVEVFTAIEQEQPGYRDAAALLKAAEQQRQLAGWLDQAEAAAGHDDWDTAVTALENLCAVDPAYRDAGARLEQARSARSVKQRRSLVDEMTALHQAGRWKEVLAAAEKLAQLDPDHPDPGGMVSDAQAKIRDAQLAEQYAQALNHLDQRHWQQAVEVFTAIEQEQPGYRDAAALLKTAQQKLAQSASLTHEQQREIIDRLQRALISADPQNRRVARQLLDRFSGRQDLHQDISQTVAQWRMELPTIQSVQQPCPPQVPKVARYRGWVTLPRHPPSIPVVVAVATVIVAVALVGVLIARDSGSISTPTTSETITPTTSETITPTTSESPVDPSPRATDNAVAQGALKGFLLSPEQINTAMGATDMRVMDSGVAMSDDSGMMKPKECLAIDGSTHAKVYAGSNFMAERDQTLQDGYHLTHFAEQAVVLYPSAKKADAFLTASAQQWPACHQYTRIQTQWTVGAISNTNGTLSTIATQQNANAPGWGCGRALAARNNVVIDVTTCSANPADSAVTIANQIAAKVPI